MTKKKLSIVAALVAAVAVPAVASADHDRRYDSRYDDRFQRWTSIGEVGTHAHDAEDFVPVNHQRLARVELMAEGRPVRLDDVKFQTADGRIVETRVQRTLHDGQSIVLEVPTDLPIKMMILDYANGGPFYRGHEDSRLEIRGLTASRFDDRYDGRYDDRYERPIIRPRPQPYPYVPRPAAVNPGVRIRGSVNVRF